MSRVRTQPFAWQGWRLRLPGGPEGGQYHGFIAPDSNQSWPGGSGGWPAGRSEIGTEQTRPSGHSLGPQDGSSLAPWAEEWGGTAFKEGQTHSDYIYRSPGETRPRPNASGGANVVFGEQAARVPGYAESPGNYEVLAGMPGWATEMYCPADGGNGMPGCTGSRTPRGVLAPIVPIRPPAPVVPISSPPAFAATPTPSPTNLVAQPPPPNSITPAPVILTYAPLPSVSPSPAPTVAATPADYLPSQGQVVVGITPGATAAPATDTTTAAPATTASGFNLSAWLSASTIWTGVPNMYVAGGALLLALFLFHGNGGRGRR